MRTLSSTTREHGFTFVELVITVAVLAILTAFATPMFFTYLRQAEVQAAAREAQVILANARSEAIRQNCSVIAARTTGGFTFARQNCGLPNGTYIVTGMRSTGVFPISAGASISGPASVQFGMLGAVELPVGGGTFTVTSTKYGTTMRVIVEPSGRTTIQQ